MVLNIITIRVIFTKDGTTLKLKDYKVTGLKFVPVKVKESDYEAFKAKYTVYEEWCLT